MVVFVRSPTFAMRKQYSLPRIADILHRRKQYKYFTKIDLSMHFYTFELDEESSWLYVIVTPHGKYRYKRLPMGVHESSSATSKRQRLHRQSIEM